MPKIITTEEFSSRIENLYGDEYVLVTPYRGRHKSIQVRHNCGHILTVEAGSFIGGHSHCKYCRTSNRRKGDSEFKKEVFKLVGDEYRNVTPYKTAKEKLCMYHSVCGKSYYVTPDNFLRGRRCPYCNQSRGESLIMEVLDHYKVKYFYNFKYPGLPNGLHFDFYLPDYRVAIEYDGKQHYQSVDFMGGLNKYYKQVYYDTYKQKFCDNTGIKLITMSYKYKDYESISLVLTSALNLKLS